MRRGLVLIILVGLLVAGGPERAGACSCARGDTRDAMSRADAAIIGRVLGARGGMLTERRLIVAVDRSLKGNVHGTIAVGGVGLGASCGLSDGPRPTAMLLRETGSGWSSDLCSEWDPDLLEASAAPLPPPRAGTIGALVAGGLSPARVVALDARGRVLGYGFGPGPTRDISVCPGGTRFADLTWSAVARRDLRTLAIIDEVGLDQDDGRWFNSNVACIGADGTSVVYQSRNTERAGRLILVEDGTARVIERGPWTSASFHGGRAILSAGRSQHELVVFDTETERIVARRSIEPRWHDEFIGHLAIDPTGRFAAAIAGRSDAADDEGKTWLIVLNLAQRRPRIDGVVVGPQWDGGPVAWAGANRIVYASGVGDESAVRVFDRALRELGSFPGWATVAAVTSHGTFLGIRGGELVRAALPAGPATSPGTLPPIESYDIEPVVGTTAIDLVAVRQTYDAVRSGTSGRVLPGSAIGFGQPTILAWILAVLAASAVALGARRRVRRLSLRRQGS